MKRRTLLAGLLGMLTVKSAAQGQRSASLSRIGVLTLEYPETLRQSLRELGYIEGRNIVLEIRDTLGRPERVADLASELVRLNVDVIVATYPAAVLSASRATTTIPIVMVNTPDPVDLGLDDSLARPGRNLTGVTSLGVDLSVKQVQLLKEAIPRASRIGMLWNPDNPWHSLAVKGLREVQIQMHEVRDPKDVENALKAMIREGVGAIFVPGDPVTFAYRNRLADLAIRHRLPMMGGPRGYTLSGGLMSYSADEVTLFQRTASYVDRILKGAKPSELPIEQPTKFELLINLPTARALNITIPASLTARADKLIQ